MLNSEITVVTQIASAFTKFFTYKITRIDTHLNNNVEGKYRLKAFAKGTDGGLISLVDPAIIKFITKSNGTYSIPHLIVRAQINKQLRAINRRYPRYEHIVTDIHLVDNGATFNFKRVPRINLDNEVYTYISNNIQQY